MSYTIACGMPLTCMCRPHAGSSSANAISSDQEDEDAEPSASEPQTTSSHTRTSSLSGVVVPSLPISSPSPSSKAVSTTSLPDPKVRSATERQAALQSEIDTANASRAALTAELRKARKETSRAESALRNEIEAIRRGLDRMSGADHRSKQKVLALQESIRQATLHAREFDDEATEVEDERDGWESKEKAVGEELEAVRKELEKSDAHRTKVMRADEVMMAELERELEQASQKLAGLDEERSKMEKETLVQLEAEIARIQRETERILRPSPKELLKNFDHPTQYPHHYLPAAPLAPGSQGPTPHPPAQAPALVRPAPGLQRGPQAGPASQRGHSPHSSIGNQSIFAPPSGNSFMPFASTGPPARSLRSQVGPSVGKGEYLPPGPGAPSARTNVSPQLASHEFQLFNAANTGNSSPRAQHVPTNSAFYNSERRPSATPPHLSAAHVALPSQLDPLHTDFVPSSTSGTGSPAASYGRAVGQPHQHSPSPQAASRFAFPIARATPVGSGAVPPTSGFNTTSALAPPSSNGERRRSFGPLDYDPSMGAFEFPHTKFPGAIGSPSASVAASNTAAASISSPQPPELAWPLSNPHTHAHTSPWSSAGGPGTLFGVTSAPSQPSPPLAGDIWSSSPIAGHAGTSSALRTRPSLGAARLRSSPSSSAPVSPTSPIALSPESFGGTGSATYIGSGGGGSTTSSSPLGHYEQRPSPPPGAPGPLSFASVAAKNESNENQPHFH